MATEEKLKEVIQQKLKENHDKVVNKNAFKALFGAFTNPIDSLGKIFLERQDALDEEQNRITQDIILEMLYQIHDAVAQAEANAEQHNLNWSSISGEIEVEGNKTENVTGIHAAEGVGPVEFKSGRHIKATANGAKNLTGLKIGATE